MTNSMTAFAREQIELDGMVFCWEIRSVNHRYLDVYFRLPDVWRVLETDLRHALRGKIARGKLECQLKMQEATSKQDLFVDEGLVGTLIAAAERIATSHQIPNDIKISTIFSWPNVIKAFEPEVEHHNSAIIASFNNAIDRLVNVRQSEGLMLKKEIELRLTKLLSEIEKATYLAQESAKITRAKLQNRLADWHSQVENSRIDQEVALLITKIDVQEELDRLRVHCQEIDKIICHEVAAGRRLDFLMQELNREANTLSSKSDSVALTQSAVEMKVLIEQMREQIQNIE